MIAMSFINAHISKFDGLEAEYCPARDTALGPVKASVSVEMNHEAIGYARLYLSIEDARTLAEQLPQILMMHDVAERLVAEKAA
ncbi:hypothetical protein [Nocardia africana]|nr:hypothetical protein [Nocardia africana]MCC3316501.1 hypothetical protein [Nocardia africana]